MFEVLNLVGEEEMLEVCEIYFMFREEEDDNLFGRKFFEKDRELRCFLIIELYYEMIRKLNLVS